MKVLILNKKEKVALQRLLVYAVKRGCSYHISNILEKLSVSEYERAFGIMDAKRGENEWPKS